MGDGAQEEGISLCPAGTRAISGAIVLGNPACAVIEFSPNDTSFTGWKVTISCPEGENSETNGVIAICIS